MKCVVLQPSYIPWRGYFHQMQKADVFVFYDDVQYDRHGWRNRNRIKTQTGLRWLTIPVKHAREEWKKKTIGEMEISWEREWNQVHLERLRHSYGKAPYFSRYRSMLERWYAARPLLLADFAVETTIELARELGLGQVRFVRSSELGCAGTKTEKLLAILKQLDATHYISGPSAQDYLDVPQLNEAGISVEWMAYEYPEYAQLYPPYESQVSVLDLLMMQGPGAPRSIWNQY